MDLEVIYSAALERQYIQSQQKTAPPIVIPPKPRPVNLGPPKPRSLSLRQIVLRHLRTRPGVYVSCEDVAKAIGEERRRVAYTFGDLTQHGFVQKQYVNHRGQHRDPQRYRAR